MLNYQQYKERVRTQIERTQQQSAPSEAASLPAHEVATFTRLFAFGGRRPGQEVQVHVSNLESQIRQVNAEFDRREAKLLYGSDAGQLYLHKRSLQEQQLRSEASDDEVLPDTRDFYLSALRSTMRALDARVSDDEYTEVILKMSELDAERRQALLPLEALRAERDRNRSTLADDVRSPQKRRLG